MYRTCDIPKNGKASVVNTHIRENIDGCFISNKNCEALFSPFLNPLHSACRHFPHAPWYLHAFCIFLVFGWVSGSICCNRFTAASVLTVQTHVCWPASWLFPPETRKGLNFNGFAFKAMLIWAVAITRNSLILNEWELLIFETIPLSDFVMAG